MTRLFSLIVPVYNHADCLPRLLDSVLAQRVGDMEVVVVDDCSDHPCDAVVAAYADKGLDISLVVNPQRINTKDSRLAGVAAAKGRYVGFADADDILMGQNSLSINLRHMAASNSDIVHFRCALVDGHGKFVSYFTQADPFGAALRGEEIFTRFAATDITTTAVIWNKIFLKELFLDAFDVLKNAHVSFYCEDLFLNSVLMPNADKYTKSDTVGYGYTYSDKSEKESLARALAMQTILEYMLPYFHDKKCNDAAIASYIRKINLGIGNCIGRVSLQFVDSQTGLLREDAFSRAFSENDTEKLMKAFALGAAVNAEKLRSCFRILTGLGRQEKIYGE